MSSKTLLLSISLAAASLTLPVLAGERAAIAQTCPPAGALTAADGSVVACPPADPVAMHQARAKVLFAAQQYREALAELQTAYALRQEAGLLLEQGRVFTKLGQIADALDAYSRYLAAEPNAPADARTEATSEISRLSAWLVPPSQLLAAPRPLLPSLRLPSPGLDSSGYQMLPVRYEQRRYTGTIAGGIVLLSLGYLPALICAPIWGSLVPHSSRSSSSLQSAVGWSLMLPVAGPFLSAMLSAGDTRRFGPEWSLPWALVDGMMQVSGLVMIIAGARNKRVVPVILDNVKVLPYSQPGGGGVAVVGRF